MSNKLRLACGTEVLVLPLEKILPLRRLDEGIRKTSKYKCIEASLRELGLIEPLVVFPQADSDGCYMLLDGHVRHMILKALGESSAKCLIATDDEGFTYNHKIKTLNPDTGDVRTFAGRGVEGHDDGPPAAATFYEPGGLTATSNALFVADTNNHAIRRVSLDDGQVRTIDVAHT